MNTTAIVNRAGYSDAPHGTEQIYNVTVLVEDRPGSVDRVVSTLRRKRAKMQTLALTPSGNTDEIRIIAQVKDTDVSVANLVEHLRKIYDVRQVTSLAVQQAVVRELALVQVHASENRQGVIEAASQFGATVVEDVSGTLTFEIHGSTETVTGFLDHMKAFDIRDVARTGAIALASRAGDR